MNQKKILLPAHIREAKRLYSLGYSVVNINIYFDIKNKKKSFNTPPNLGNLTYEECNKYIGSTWYNKYDKKVTTNGLMLLTGIRKGNRSDLKNCICFDLDNINGDEIDGSLFIEEHKELFKGAYIETTGNGGKHYIFEMNPKIKQNIVYSGRFKYKDEITSIDILLNTKFVVLAPSKYTTPTGIKKYTSINSFDDMEQVPDELYDMIDFKPTIHKQTNHKPINSAIEDIKINMDDVDIVVFLKTFLNNKTFQKFNGYNDWMVLGMAIKNELSDNGFEIFNLISKQFQSGYTNINDCFSYFNDLKRSYDRKVVKFPSIVRLIKQKLTLVEYNEIYKQYQQQLKDNKLSKINQLDDYSFDTNNIDKFSIDYFDSLDGYQLKKKYFELFNAKISDPKTHYICFHKYKLVNHFIYDRKTLTEKYENLFYTEVVKEKDINVPFIFKWLKDPKMLTYDTSNFNPYNGFNHKNTNLNEYNMFNGFNPAIESDFNEEDNTTLEVFKDILLNMCDDSLINYTYMYNYIAHIIQKPQDKMPISIILKSYQGVGKNTILDIIGSIINRQHYTTTSEINDIFGAHSEGFSNKLLINLNEIDITSTYNLENRIKSFITEDTIGTNFKNVRCSSINNVARVIFTSNKSHIMPIDIKTGDRRFVIFQSTQKYATCTKKYNGEFWSNFIKSVKKDSFISCLYNDLNKIDLNGIDWVNNRPITKAYLEQAKNNIPIEGMFMSKYIDDITNDENDENEDNEIHIIERTILYGLFKLFKRDILDNNLSYSLIKFNNRLNDLDLPMDIVRMKKGPMRDKRCIKFNILDMKNELEAKHYNF